MKKKIIDITPPGEKAEIVFEGEKKDKPKKKRSNRGFWWILLFLILLGAVLYSTAGLYSKFTLYLQPTTESQTFEEELEANISQSNLDLENKVIPAKLFETEKATEQTFQVQGENLVEGKAEGIIRVYNSTTPPRPIILRASTRFLSSEGEKIFRAPEKISLPPAAIKGGKVEPSFKDVKVVAQEGGEDYNIGPSKFSVPGLAGTSIYYTVWAESTEAMKNGFRRKTKVLSEEDLERGKKELERSLKALAESSLESEMGKDFVLGEGALSVENLETSCEGEAGEEIAQFSCRGSIKALALALPLSDLKNFARAFILKNIPSIKDFDPQSLSFNYLVKNFQGETGKMVLLLKMRVNLYDKVPREVLLAGIKGKSEREIEQAVFRIYPQVREMDFKFWPFFAKKAPKSGERIKIILDLSR